MILSVIIIMIIEMRRRKWSWKDLDDMPEGLPILDSDIDREESTFCAWISTLSLSLSPVMIIGYYEKGHERGIESEMEKRKKEEKWRGRCTQLYRICEVISASETWNVFSSSPSLIRSERDSGKEGMDGDEKVYWSENWYEWNELKVSKMKRDRMRRNEKAARGWWSQ